MSFYFCFPSQSEYDDFISSGLYLVVLLHFCEQRFSDVLGAVDAAGVRILTFYYVHSVNYAGFQIKMCLFQRPLGLI